MASLTVTGPGGSLFFQVIPGGNNFGLSPPPTEQTVQHERAIVTHPIPAREGDRKIDGGRYDSTLRLRGICTAGMKDTMNNMVMQRQLGLGVTGYTINFSADSGYGFTYPTMILKSVSHTPRAESAIWYNFEMLFVEKNQ